MKKLIILISSIFLLARICYSAPSVTLSISNTFSPNTVISSSQVNVNFTDVKTAYNAHSHTDITQLGTITTGVWQGTAIATGYGGTGQNLSTTQSGSILYFSNTGTISALAPGTVGQALTTGGGLSWAGMTTQGDIEYHSGAIRTRLPAGTSGYFLKTQGAGANPVWSALTAGSELFTSSGTFTAPSGITTVYLTMCAGGGGGAGADTGSTRGGGGGAGECVISFPYTVVGGNNYTVTRGAGGAGGAAQGSGSDGNDTTFDTLTVSKGIKGIIGVPGTGGAGGGTANRNASSQTAGDVGFVGGNGAGSDGTGGGGGGSTPCGAGGAGGTDGNVGNAGTRGGGGGGAGVGLLAGGGGGNGFILVEY